MSATLYYTVTRNEIRSQMPAVPILVSAAGWTVASRRSKNGYHLRAPPLPAQCVSRAADCGGFVATTRWNGHYRFTPRQYVAWLLSWQPQWAATMDLCCINRAENGTFCYPGEKEVERRQQFTTEMAYLFWTLYQDNSITWCPTIQGFYLEEYVRHAHELAPLIEEMFGYYLDTGSTDEEQEQQDPHFRVGIGSLCGRASPAFVYDVIRVVRTTIGLVPLHLWGTKLGFLKYPVDLESEGCISLDTSAWNGLFFDGHEKRRESGLSRSRYSWEVSYPHYANRIQEALAAPKIIPLLEPFVEKSVASDQLKVLRPSNTRSSGEEPGELPAFSEIDP